MSPSLPEKIKVLIVDDHTLFNDGLSSILSKDPSIEVVEQIYHSRLAMDSVHRTSPDVALLDFNMPGMNGLELAKKLKSSFSGLKLLILSMYGDERFIEEFRKVGVEGYVLKTADMKELIKAISTVVNGGTYFDPRIAISQSADIHANDNFLKKVRLTPKEREVLKLIKAGLKNSEIAQKLFLTQSTVETHRKNIHFKLQTKGAAELYRWLLENEI
jgi:DNA-binding NarL/FixJ family response regulator